jgi:RHS repeat-associated protein
VFRGYTGHEHLDHVGFIHMNGRIYAAELGRFASPDPFVQFPEDSQGLNRYAYVANNPLSATDPSGYFTRPGRGRFRGNAFRIGRSGRCTTGEQRRFRGNVRSA